MDAVEAADLRIITTPTYCMRASAGIKSLMELTFTCWMSHRPRACMFRKRAIVVSAAADAGANAAITDITNALVYMGVADIYTHGVAAHAGSWDEISTATRNVIEKRLKKLSGKVSQCRKIRTGIRTRFLFGMMAMMQKKGYGSGPF